MAGEKDIQHAESLLRKGKPVPDKISARLQIRVTPNGYWYVLPAEMPHDWSRNVVATAARSSSIMDARRAAKEKQYRRMRARQTYKGPTIVAEGDSWFEHPLSPDLLVDLGKKYAVLSLAKAGDTWGDIFEQDELLSTIKREKAHIVLLSAGGNPILIEFNRYVQPLADLERPGADFLLPAFRLEAIEPTISQYEFYIREILKLNAHVVVHGYAYPDPRILADGGEFIGPRLEPIVHGGVGLWRKIVNAMLDIFNEEMAKLVRIKPSHVHYIDLRKVIGTPEHLVGPDRFLWFDEIHPSTLGVEKIVPKFSATIDEIWAARAGS